MTLDWIHLAQVAGALQGVVLGAALATHRTNRTANRLLAALMVAFSVSLLSEVYYAAGLVATWPHLFGLSHPLPWLFGPLVYLYAVAASDRRRRLGKRDALHLAPAAVVVLLTLPIYLSSGAEKLALFDRLSAGDVPTTLLLLAPTKFVSGIAYSAATLALLRAHRRRVEVGGSSTEPANLRWLQSLAGAAAGIWLVAVVAELAGLLPAAAERWLGDAVSLGVLLLVYAIGYRGLRQPEIFRHGVAPRPLVLHARPAPGPDPEPPATAGAEPAAPERSDARYDRSGLGEFEARQLGAALPALMLREHPYRDAELTLAALAERLGTTPHKLSEVLNRELAQGFHDFVNGYRVSEVCARLADPGTRHLNILALGLDAGFASKSTFNQAFKKLTGQTPSAYRRALEERKALAG